MMVPKTLTQPQFDKISVKEVENNVKTLEVLHQQPDQLIKLESPELEQTEKENTISFVNNNCTKKVDI